MTQKTLPEGDVEFWMKKLGRYSRKKLGKLIDYSGDLNHNVFAYLDAIRLPEAMPEYLKQLPEPRTEAGKITCRYLDIIYSDTATSETKDNAEKEWVATMRARGIGVSCQRPGNAEMQNTGQ